MNEMKNAIQNINNRHKKDKESVNSNTDHLKLSCQRRIKEKMKNIYMNYGPHQEKQYTHYGCLRRKEWEKGLLLLLLLSRFPNTPDPISFYHQRGNSSPTPYSYSLVSHALLPPFLQAHKYTQISQLQASWHKWFSGVINSFAKLRKPLRLLSRRKCTHVHSVHIIPTEEDP